MGLIKRNLLKLVARWGRCGIWSSRPYEKFFCPIGSIGTGSSPFLRDEADGAVLEVEDGGRVPVLGGVDVALRGRGHHQVTVAQRRLDYAVAELQLLPRVVRHVAQGDALSAW